MPTPLALPPPKTPPLMATIRFFPQTPNFHFPPTFSRYLHTTPKIPPPPPPKAQSKAAAVAQSKAAVAQLKEDWLESLTCPFPAVEVEGEVRGDGWVIGIDPDLSGAIAVLKPDGRSGCTAQVFDNPFLPVLVGKKVRKRLDTKSMVQLLHSLDAPAGTTAYIEQSRPIPQDGKQGWWCGGFTYGLWIGVLVASGFNVVPVCSRLWKEQFDLYSCSSTKDDSIKAALELFPFLSSSLKRKKDHGRAEALLIAAYARGMKFQRSLMVIEDLYKTSSPE